MAMNKAKKYRIGEICFQEFVYGMQLFKYNAKQQKYGYMNVQLWAKGGVSPPPPYVRIVHTNFKFQESGYF